MTKKKSSPKPIETPLVEDINSSNVEGKEGGQSVETAQVEQVDNTSLIEGAVAAGRQIIEEGKPKIEAAMAIYEKLEQLPQETVVQAFIDGANLTTKGALTYWYNCRRKLKKMRVLPT